MFKIVHNNYKQYIFQHGTAYLPETYSKYALCIKYAMFPTKHRNNIEITLKSLPGSVSQRGYTNISLYFYIP